ncbi:MAG: DUF4157 domain-containing protein [Acidobacteriota bacterium]|nr:DUF4157 domain-containing protein [Acidobacteriota bacterium]
MNLPQSLAGAIEQGRVKVRVGYPWWLRHLLLRDVIAITLGRRIYVSAKVTEAYLEKLLRHELAHVRQIERHGLIGFYWLYVTEFARHFWRVRSISRAYSLISFEREAVAAEEVL